VLRKNSDARTVMRASGALIVLMFGSAAAKFFHHADVKFRLLIK
jgi:hypothetical protein